MDNHYFIYPEDSKGNKTGHTICILLDKDPKTGDPRAYYGIAVCSNRDQFSFDTGRKLSYSRAVEALQKRKEKYESTNS